MLSLSWVTPMTVAPAVRAIRAAAAVSLVAPRVLLTITREPGPRSAGCRSTSSSELKVRTGTGDRSSRQRSGRR